MKHVIFDVTQKYELHVSFKNRRSPKLSTCMGVEYQMLQFAKEDLNLKIKHLEQLET